MARPKTIRCAIYTRKSSEEGLEQEFNSLDAQREAGESYIKSQKHEGWEVIQTFYDDGGFSGGNMERPALKRLLSDIESDLIDIVVVYKVDRLSRALSDFARMVELFDSHKVSFVSVTQQFNTTTSMGRLTLNVLLSFAQFEREVTGERIRDKFAASKKKGMWMGGPQPLGYDVVDRKLVINRYEANIIKYIFEYYISNISGEPLWKLLDILRSKGWKNKSYISQKGNKIIGKEFNLNKIHNILNNPLYNGKMKHKSEIYAGEHDFIIDDELWSKVHLKIDKKDFIYKPSKKSEQPKLVGKIFDYLGNRLRPTYSYKYSLSGRYKMRYYINQEISKKGKTISEFKRIRSDYIDDIVIFEISSILDKLITKVSTSGNEDISSLILRQLKEFKSSPTEFLDNIKLFPQYMFLSLKFQDDLPFIACSKIEDILKDYKVDVSSDNGFTFIKLNIKAQYKRASGQIHIITENGSKIESNIDVEYYHPDNKTFSFIAKSFYWNKMIDKKIYSAATQISRVESQNIEYVKRSIKQRFLSPRIINSIISTDSNLKEGEIGVEELSNLSSWNWEVQEKVFFREALKKLKERL